MHFKTAVTIAFGVALVLPLLTIGLVESSDSYGVYLVAGLFVAAISLVIVSDLRGTSEESHNT